MPPIPERLTAALSDRYRLERELGAGGMATVYLAEDLKHHRQVAVKVLRPDLAATLGAERFFREIAIAARLSHPHILGLHDSGEADGFLYYVMPYVEGISLRQKLAREGELPIPEAVRILRDVTDALAHAHGQGVVHRDIKPENVMLTGRHALVMDFGVAKAVGEARGADASSLTSAGVALGTPAYMAPEQAAGEAHVDHRADLYAWGILAYELLAGQPPFVRATPQATLAAQVTATPEPVTAHRANVPGALTRLVMQCLEKKAADRPQSAEEVLRTLEQVLTPSVGMTPTDTRPYQTAGMRRAKRRQLLTGGVVAAGFAVVALLGWRWWQGRAEPIVADRVLIVPLEAEGEEFEGLARDLAALPTAMSREGIGSPVPATQVRDLVGDRGGDPARRAEHLGRRTGAGYVLRTSCAPQGSGFGCQLELSQRPGNRLRMAVPVRGAALDSAFSSRVQEQALAMLLLELYWGDQTVWLGEHVTPSLEAARLFQRAWEETTQKGRSEYLMRAAAADPNWIIPVVEAAANWPGHTPLQKDSALRTLGQRPGLSDRDRAVLDWFSEFSRPDGYSDERHFQITERLYRSWPSQYATPFIRLAVATGRLEAGLEAGRRAISFPAGRGSLHIWYTRMGWALHQLGRYQEQLALSDTVRAQLPGNATLINVMEYSARAGLGDVEGVKRALAAPEASGGSISPVGATVRAMDAGLELMAHGRQQEGEAMVAAALAELRKLREEQGVLDGRDWEARALVWTGQLEEAQRLVEEAIRGRPAARATASTLGTLGTIAARQGRREEALGYARELADSAVSARQNLATNRTARYLFYGAAVAAALGDRDEAVRLLGLARRANSEDGEASFMRAHKDPDLASLRGYPPYEALFEPRK